MQPSRLKLSGRCANYIISEGKNRPLTGYDGQNVLQSMFNWHGRQINYDDFKDYKNPDGSFILNTADPNYPVAYGWPIAPIPAWQNNPYPNLYENVNSDRRDRLIANFKITYDFADWLSAYIRAGNDHYSDQRQQVFVAGLKDPPNYRDGGYIKDNYVVNMYNIDFVLDFHEDFGQNWSTSLLLGANRFHREVSNQFTNVQGLLIPGIYNISNAAGTPDNREYESVKRINGVYAAAQVAFKNQLFIDLTARNDWSSTLPAENRSYFYPSASASWVFSETIGLPDWFSFGKIRAGIATVGNDTEPYVLQSYFVRKRVSDNQADITFPFNGQPSFTLGDELANADLLPEETTSYEFGLDVRFLKGRIGLDFTYYYQNTINQLMRLTVPSSTGFSSQWINAGKINNKGMEVILDLAVIRNNNFRWDIAVNFANNQSTVVELHPQIESIILETHRAQTEARPGRPYGEIYGTAWNRVDDPSSPFHGRRIIEDDGRPTRAPGGNQLLGNINPDFMMGINNYLNFKGVYLSFLVDWRQGGEMFSLTNFFGGYSGVMAYTSDGRDGTYIAEGVARNPDGTYRENDIPVEAESYWHRTFSAQEEGVYDASFVKLRELKIGYDFPQSMIGNSFIKKLNVSLIGRNLAILSSNVPNIDPESSAYASSNGQGFEVNGIPSVRSFGGGVTISF